MLTPPINFNPVQYQCIGVFVLLASLCYAHITVYKLFSGLFAENCSLQKKGAVWFSIGVVFCNPFIAEWFYYVETTFVYATAVLFCALALQQLTKNTRKGWVLAFLYAVIAVNGYQVIISNFLILGALYFLIEERFELSLKSFARIMGTVAISAAASVTALICAKIIPAVMGMEARFSQVSIEKNIKYIISRQGNLWKSGLGLMLNNWFIVALIVCSIVIAVSLCRNKKWMTLIWTAVVLTGCFLSAFLVHYVNSEQWMVPRSTVSFFCFVASLLLCAVWLWPNRKYSAMLSVGLTLLFLVGCGVQVWRVTLQQIETNRLDRNEIMQIDQAIEQYERDNNIKVEKCTISKDQSITYVHPGITLSSGEINQRVFSVEWAVLDSIEFYTGRKLQSALAPETIAKEFSEQNWTEFNVVEQLIFDGDTVHICVY